MKVIIIGATSGIGKELAILFAKDNCTVGITGRRNELLQEIKLLYPDRIFTECFDVTGKENIQHIENLIDLMGGMDLLIYNAGYGDPSKTLDWKIEKQTVSINVNGFIEIVNFTFNYFVKQGYGHIGATSSIASKRGNSFAPAYSASKAFMSIYMEGLSLKARKFKKQNPNISIYTTDIQPGFVKTKMAKGNGQFWVAPIDKAVKQIYKAIKNKKRRVYITHRWALIAWIMKWIPYWIYRKIG
jgi:short-subunit dehydrogenase